MASSVSLTKLLEITEIHTIQYELFENMKRICEGRTVIFISHRLSSAISADVIFMMEHGRIIERGNHESLMQQKGKYAEMFRKQAEKYE